jgi:hypothetical protein
MIVPSLLSAHGVGRMPAAGLVLSLPAGFAQEHSDQVSPAIGSLGHPLQLERGTITPFGSARPWPVIADERVRGRTITLGAGEHGLALAADADAILRALAASVADISDPEPAT